MKTIYCLMILLWPFVSTGQTIKPLSIGDKIPDITLTHVYNYPASTIHLSDLKGKLVILDFWATWCGSCIHHFPELDSIQKEFCDNLQIILINNNGEKDANEKTIKEVFKKLSSSIKGAFILPSNTKENQLLLQLFPHTFIPHYVWIDVNQKVIAITASAQITRANIETVIKGEKVALPLKDDNKIFDN